MSGQLLAVAPEDVDKVWPFVADMIDDAYAAMDEDTPDVRRWLVERKGILWVYATDDQVIHAIVTTSLVRKRGGRLACRMVACGGRMMEAWKHHHATIEEYARGEGCYKVMADGRPGWARVLEGYNVTAVKLEKGIG